MSEENVERVRTLWELWRQGDEAWLDLIDPDVEWDASRYPVPDLPVGGKGRDRYRAAASEYVRGWPGYSGLLKQLIDAGDHVVAVVHETIAAARGELPLERDLFHLYTFDEGRVTKVAFFRTRAEALEAAGLSE